MDYTTLGRTGLEVSVAGLGCGGFSRLGLGTGKHEDHAIGIIHTALDVGVNLFDTAAAYGTEAVLGRALRTVPRDRVVICTKAPFGVSSPNSTAASAVASLYRSLKELGTDYIDVYQLHGIAPTAYDHALNELAPALLREKEKGKFRHLGISETAPHDPAHRMVTRACRDGVWEVAITELAARDNIDVVRGQLLPQVSVVGTLSRSHEELTTVKGTLLNTAQTTAQLTMPLYEGGAIYSQTRQAEQTVGQRRSQVDDARRAAVQTATQFWSTLQAGRASIASFSAAVRAAQIALAGVQQQAMVGTSTTLDVLIQNQQLLNTQSQLITAQHDAALAEFNLAASVGRLIAPELKLPVKLYDMEQHYKEVKNKWIGFRGGLSE